MLTYWWFWCILHCCISSLLEENVKRIWFSSSCTKFQIQARLKSTFLFPVCFHNELSHISNMYNIFSATVVNIFSLLDLHFKHFWKIMFITVKAYIKTLMYGGFQWLLDVDVLSIYDDNLEEYNFIPAVQNFKYKLD